MTLGNKPVHTHLHRYVPIHIVVKADATGMQCVQGLEDTPAALSVIGC